MTISTAVMAAAGRRWHLLPPPPLACEPAASAASAASATAAVASATSTATFDVISAATSAAALLGSVPAVTPVDADAAAPRAISLRAPEAWCRHRRHCRTLATTASRRLPRCRRDEPHDRRRDRLRDGQWCGGGDGAGIQTL